MFSPQLKTSFYPPTLKKNGWNVSYLASYSSSCIECECFRCLHMERPLKGTFLWHNLQVWSTYTNPVFPYSSYNLFCVKEFVKKEGGEGYFLHKINFFPQAEKYDITPPSLVFFFQEKYKKSFQYHSLSYSFVFPLLLNICLVFCFQNFLFNFFNPSHPPISSHAEYILLGRSWWTTIL